VLGLVSVHKKLVERLVVVELVVLDDDHMGFVES
jgi:hypothetical protein